MACYHLAASHYLKQCWLIVNEVLWHSAQDISSKNEFEWYNFILTSSRAHWAKHGPLARYLQLRARHAPGMSGTFSPPPRVSDPDMHYGTCVTPVPWCMPRSLTCGFLWSRWRGQRSRHSRRMRKLQFCLSAPWVTQIIDTRVTKHGGRGSIFFIWIV